MNEPKDYVIPVGYIGKSFTKPIKLFDTDEDNVLITSEYHKKVFIVVSDKLNDTIIEAAKDIARITNYEVALITNEDEIKQLSNVPLAAVPRKLKLKTHNKRYK